MAEGGGFRSLTNLPPEFWAQHIVPRLSTDDWDTLSGGMGYKDRGSRAARVTLADIQGRAGAIEQSIFEGAKTPSLQRDTWMAWERSFLETAENIYEGQIIAGREVRANQKVFDALAKNIDELRALSHQGMFRKERAALIKLADLCEEWLEYMDSIRNRAIRDAVLANDRGGLRDFERSIAQDCEEAFEVPLQVWKYDSEDIRICIIGIVGKECLVLWQSFAINEHPPMRVTKHIVNADNEEIIFWEYEAGKAGCGCEPLAWNDAMGTLYHNVSIPHVHRLNPKVRKEMARFDAQPAAVQAAAFFGGHSMWDACAKLHELLPSVGQRLKDAYVKRAVEFRKKVINFLRYRGDPEIYWPDSVEIHHGSVNKKSEILRFAPLKGGFAEPTMGHIQEYKDRSVYELYSSSIRKNLQIGPVKKRDDLFRIASDKSRWSDNPFVPESQSVATTLTLLHKKEYAKQLVIFRDHACVCATEFTRVSANGVTVSGRIWLNDMASGGCSLVHTLHASGGAAITKVKLLTGTEDQAPPHNAMIDTERLDEVESNLDELIDDYHYRLTYRLKVAGADRGLTWKTDFVDEHEYENVWGVYSEEKKLLKRGYVSSDDWVPMREDEIQRGESYGCTTYKPQIGMPPASAFIGKTVEVYIQRDGADEAVLGAVAELKLEKDRLFTLNHTTERKNLKDLEQRDEAFARRMVHGNSPFAEVTNEQAVRECLEYLHETLRAEDGLFDDADKNISPDLQYEAIVAGGAPKNDDVEGLIRRIFAARTFNTIYHNLLANPNGDNHTSHRRLKDFLEPFFPFIRR